MPDKRCAGPECRVAEYVIRVIVRVDHVTDRLVGYGMDGHQQTLSDGDAAAGVHDGDGVLSYDDAEIGDVAGIFGRGQGDLAEMGVVARCNFLHGERCGRRRRSSGRAGA